MNNKVTASDIKIALSQYKPKDYFITECKTGSTYFPPAQGLLKFDGIGISRSYTQECITGYEIKVSRADFLQDNKWHLYLQYCHEFYFVCPKDLIKKEELPVDVGLIYYNPENKLLRVKKKAVHRKIDLAPEMYKYIIYSRLDEDRIPFFSNQAEYAEAYVKYKHKKKELGEIFGTTLTKALSEAEKKLEDLADIEEERELYKGIAKVLHKYNITYSDDLTYYNVNSVVERLEDALKSSVKTRDLERIKRNLTYALNEIEEIENRSLEEKKENDSESKI